MSQNLSILSRWMTKPLIRYSIYGLSCILILACLVGGLWQFARYQSERKRTQWKVEALERLAKTTITNSVVLAELAELKSPKTNDVNFGWAHDHVLLMTNGEFIEYEYRHGANDYFPPHLFLGRCSDGHWLYSSYHFCNSMNMVWQDNAPGSVAEFARRYSVKEFDGKSDDCLKITQ